MDNELHNTAPGALGHRIGQLTLSLTEKGPDDPKSSGSNRNIREVNFMYFIETL
jgi:hypothetical protein